MRVATATIAVASVVAAATFAGYATGSLRTVTDTFDDVLTRSEAPPPKKWKAVSKAQRGAPASFEARVAGRTRPTPAPPAAGSRFERILDERSAEDDARDAAFRSRVGKATAPAKPSGTQEFSRRVRAVPAASPRKSERSPFRARVERNRRLRTKGQASPKKLPFRQRLKGRRE
jgi:hypothetical protein